MPEKNVRSVAAREPVAFSTVLNTAIAATWGVVVIVAEVPSDVAGGVTVAIGAWMAVLGWFTRRYTTPFSGDV